MKLSKKSFSWDDNVPLIDDELFTMNYNQLSEDLNLSTSMTLPLDFAKPSLWDMDLETFIMDPRHEEEEINN